MFQSGRNQVYPVLRRGEAAVEKHFASLEDWRNECRLYAALKGKLPLPDVLDAGPGRLLLSYHGAPTLLAELRRQELQGFDPAPWQALGRWLKTCHRECGELPDGGDLRNFLWDSAGGQVIGLDLGCCKPSGFAECCGQFSVNLLGGAPEGTEVKRRAAAALRKELDVPAGPAAHVLPALPARQNRHLSGVILAGGASCRMGTNKAELRLGGVTLLQLQIEKMRALGIADIMLSGEACPRLPGVRVIPDEMPGNGPLGGLHACLRAARHQACLVLSVDVPLIPAAALSYLCLAHQGGATMTRHGGREEPLMAVYDSGLSERASALLREGRRSVRELLSSARRSGFVYRGPEELLKNCNTPGEFSEAACLADMYAAAGISLVTFGLP